MLPPPRQVRVQPVCQVHAENDAPLAGTDLLAEKTYGLVHAK